MSERSAHHATFTIERFYPVPPARVFTAWADPAAKRRWFLDGDGWESGPHEFDFRVGGRESVTSRRTTGGPSHVFHATYQDIVPNERIVYTYDMHLDEARISVSLATIEFKPDPAGTRLLLTEQGVYLDGFDKPAQREEGTRWLLDNLATALRTGSANA